MFTPSRSPPHSTTSQLGHSKTLPFAHSTGGIHCFRPRVRIANGRNTAAGLSINRGRVAGGPPSSRHITAASSSPSLLTHPLSSRAKKLHLKTTNTFITAKANYSSPPPPPLQAPNANWSYKWMTYDFIRNSTSLFETLAYCSAHFHSCPSAPPPRIKNERRHSTRAKYTHLFHIPQCS